jgi:hypothetical protein
MMTPNEFYTFQMDGLPDIRNDLDRGNMVVSAVKVRNLLRAFDYVQRLHTSDVPRPAYAPIAPGSAVYRAAHGAGGSDNG